MYPHVRQSSDWVCAEEPNLTEDDVQELTTPPVTRDLTQSRILTTYDSAAMAPIP
jgi:hypothetical protein